VGPVKKILLVDADADLRASLGEQFGLTGDFEVIEADNAARALERIDAGHVDLVILEVGLPDSDGRELCHRLRSRGVRCPIMILTGQDSDSDTIRGLDAGANDYVTKPFRFAVLLARVRAQLRAHEQSDDALVHLGPYTFRPSQKLLFTSNDRRIRLTEKETAILRLLHRSAGAVVPRDVLLNEVWGYSPALTTHTLETHIYRLRQKIEPDPSSVRLLLTEPGGYRLVVQGSPARPGPVIG
jgi:DNA-binding response OmpR family regulator